MLHGPLGQVLTFGDSMKAGLLLDDRGCDPTKAEVDGQTQADGTAADYDYSGPSGALVCTGQLALLQLPPYSSRAVLE